MLVLAVASEAFPLVKTGGLADVVGALPKALSPLGIRVVTMLPGYPAVMAALGRARSLRNIPDLFGGAARLVRGEVAGLEIIAVDAPHLYAREGSPYQMQDGREWPDNALRFAALGAAAALVAQDGLRGMRFAVVHAHDWQGGLAAAYLRQSQAPVRCLFTVHNLAFQGRFEAGIFPRLGLPWEFFSTHGVEYYGGVGFLKAGLWYSDAISTVSPTYAVEIRTPALGMGLDGLLRSRKSVLHGILNGIDVSEWDPGTDMNLASQFNAENVSPRLVNKASVQRALGLEERPECLLFAYVGRLAWQKGVDIILEATPAIFETGGQLALLGAGDAELVERCLGAARANPGRVGSRIGFDEGFARLLYGGADAILVPSRFEPCGLTQLYAQRYGSLPIVARTGGLADTVVDANHAALGRGWGTGFSFVPDNLESLCEAISRTGSIWRDRIVWQGLLENAMRTDVSWAPSARCYATILRSLSNVD